MSIKISELPSASSVGSSDVIPIVQGGTTKKAEAMLLNLDNYSTTEQRIGTWIDGKPLYQVVLTTTMPSTTTDGTYASSLSPYAKNVDYAWIVAHWVVDPSGQHQPLPYFTNGGYFAKAFITNNSGTNANQYLIANAITSFNSLEVKAIIRYTKTTDTATINSLNTAKLMNTGELVGMGDRVELTTLATSLDNEQTKTTEEKTEGSGDSI